MVCPLGLRGVCSKTGPWMLKQVQHDARREKAETETDHGWRTGDRTSSLLRRRAAAFGLGARRAPDHRRGKDRRRRNRRRARPRRRAPRLRSEEHPSELQSLMRISYAVFCLKKKKNR